MESFVNQTTVDPLVVAQQTLERVGAVGKWLQAIGIVVLIFIIFAIVNWWDNRRRLKMLSKMNKDLERLEKKVDKLGKKK